MDRYIQLTTTTRAREDALGIAAALVDRRLAACVQVLGPITSVYRWQGEVEETEEFLLQAKSRQDLFPEIERLMEEIHPYQEPELIAVPLTGTGASYAEWLASELR